MRKNIVAGNWKMNTRLDDAVTLVDEFLNLCSEPQTTVILAPPFPYLVPVVELTKDLNNIGVAAQNCSQNASGAFTGEVSAEMIASTGAEYVIVGHSERRQYFKEDELILSEKVNKALQNDLNPIYCVGELRDDRENGNYKEVIEKQLTKALFHLSELEMRKVILAYEPVWAIGTGLTATPEQAEEVHAFIRSLLADQYGDELANATSILYGGSCKPDNATELFACENIDGGLIGGASLKAADFHAIVNAAKPS